MKKEIKKKEEKDLCICICQHEIWGLFNSLASCSRPWQFSQFFSNFKPHTFQPGVTTNHNASLLRRNIFFIIDLEYVLAIILTGIKTERSFQFLKHYFFYLSWKIGMINNEMLLIKRALLNMIWFMSSKV